MTDVVIQNMMTDQKTRLKCHNYVKNIALYNNRLAVQLSDRINIFELSHPHDPYSVRYRIKDSVKIGLDYNLLAVASRH
eukprot:11774995-Ditylum_brightwellii.AAC.1